MTYSNSSDNSNNSDVDDAGNPFEDMTPYDRLTDEEIVETMLEILNGEKEDTDDLL